MWVRATVAAVAVVFLAGSFVQSEKIFLSSYWTADDTKRIAQSFQHTLAKKDDLALLHYAASGLRLLNQKVDDATAKRVCGLAQKADLKNAEQLYHAASIAGDLQPCTISAGEAKAVVEGVAKDEGVNAEKLFEALTIADRLDLKVDQAAFDKALTATIGKDASPKNLANALTAASLLDKAMASKYFDKIGSLVEQADEVDGKFLQLDGGLSVTATAVYGIAQLAEKLGKPPALSKDQVLLVTNYLLSRRQVFAERAAYNAIRAIGVLINNNYFVPASVSLESAADVNKPIRVRVSNVFGLALPGGATVKTEKLVKGEAVIEKAKAATKVSGDSTNTLYELSFGSGKEAGQYALHLVLEGTDRKVIGTTGIVFGAHATQEAVVEGLKVAVQDKEGSAVGKEQSVATFSKAGQALIVDASYRVVVTFAVKAKAGGAALLPHQAFVVFEHVDSGAEITFVADAQKDGSYKLTVNLAKEGGDFDGHSGKYRLRLVVADALIATPINWIFADATLTVPAAPHEAVKKSQAISYEKLPEIQHLFRQPEKRPPSVVSDAFTILAVAPLLVLLVLWLRTGANLAAMPASIYVPIFHFGLSALFFLYFVFWLQLNMFETLKYIAVIGGVTFIAGNRLLRTLAERRGAKNN